MREPDRWCPHCKQNVYLSEGRHFCEEVMGYLFGIELDRPHDEDRDAPATPVV